MDTRSATYGQMMTSWCKIKDNGIIISSAHRQSNNGTVYPQGSMARKISIRFSLADGTQKKSISLAKRLPARIIKNPESLSVGFQAEKNLRSVSFPGGFCYNDKKMQQKTVSGRFLHILNRKRNRRAVMATIVIDAGHGGADPELF